MAKHDTPPSMDACMMILLEQVAKTIELIAMIMTKQDEAQGQPNQGIQVVIQSKDKDPNALYEKFRKRGATEFHGNEDAIQAYERCNHIGDVFETVL